MHPKFKQEVQQEVCGAVLCIAEDSHLTLAEFLNEWVYSLFHRCRNRGGAEQLIKLINHSYHRHDS